MTVARVAPRVPSRGNAFSRALGNAALRASRWRIEGSFPDIPKFVLIVAPHTSNWDFLVGLQAMFALGLRLSYLAKHTLFWFPLGAIMRWLGGVAVNRSVHADRVRDAIEEFKRCDQLILVVTPEGTRKKVPQWKRGFYHVAVGAGVPIVPVSFDYSRRLITIWPPFTPTGNADADIEQVRGIYKREMAKRPNNF
jgi:1-acyl-sn-glycerol-3-phosphate acyltransferase